MLSRRLLLAGATLLPLAPRPARATPADVAAAIHALTKGAPLRPGRVKLDIPLLVENGNAVAMTVAVPDPLPPAERVLSLHVFAQANPLPNVINAYFGPRSAAPRLATRIRLATSQTVIAIAACADGTFWTDNIELLVTLAACIDEI